MENLVVVLVAARNGLNMGAVARAMSNFGAMDLRVVTPYEKAFREARSAVGAEELLKNAREFETVAEAIADCSLVVGTTAVGNREVQHPLRSLEEAGEKICEGREEKLRRMLRRFALEERDAEVLLGMVRKILWKLGGEEVES